MVSASKKLPTPAKGRAKRVGGDGREGADTPVKVDNSCRVFESVTRDVARTLEVFGLEGNMATVDVRRTCV